MPMSSARRSLRDVIVNGTNELVVSQPGRFGLGGSTVQRIFTFDPAGPLLMVPAAVPVSTAGAPDCPARPRRPRHGVDRQRGALTIEPGGAFTFPVAAGRSAITLVATDAEGMTAEEAVAGHRRSPAGAAPTDSRRPRHRPELGGRGRS